MPAWNFKSCFAALVASGAKPHTIRARRKDGRSPKVGEPAYLYTGMRTRACRLLRTETVLAVTPIKIIPGFGRVVLGAGSLNYPGKRRELSRAEIARLANLDGFDGDHEFFDWFEDVHGTEFDGCLISGRRARRSWNRFSPPPNTPAPAASSTP
jgi:hypothetical protein